MKELLKATARAVATIMMVPAIASFKLRAALVGPNRALTGSSQLWSLVPGIAGQYLRRALLAHVLEGGCAASAVIEFGVLLSQVGSQIDDGVYVGKREAHWSPHRRAVPPNCCKVWALPGRFVHAS